MDNDLISRDEILRELEKNINFYRQKAKFDEHAELYWARINALQDFRGTIEHTKAVQK